MTSTFSKNLRRARRAKDVTQEQFADAVGVTAQSVSKWETGVSMPDIALLPAIANYLDISADTLLGIDRVRAKARIAELHDEFYRIFLSWDTEKIFAFARAALAEFPNNPRLLGCLAYAHWHFDADKSEAARLYEKIMELSSDAEEKDGAVTFAVSCYLDKRADDFTQADYDKVMSIVQKLPESKKIGALTLGNGYAIMRRFQGKEFTDKVKGEIIRNINGALHNMEKLTGGRYGVGPSDLTYEERIVLDTQAIEILHIAFGERLYDRAYEAAGYCERVARWNMKLGNRNGAIDALIKMWEYAEEFDAYDETSLYTAPITQGFPTVEHNWLSWCHVKDLDVTRGGASDSAEEIRFIGSQAGRGEAWINLHKRKYNYAALCGDTRFDALLEKANTWADGAIS